MASKSKIHIGLEIGTSKTCMVIGEVYEDTTVKILGVCTSRSAGVVRGEIQDFSMARSCLRHVVLQAEELCDRVESVYLSITGAHIESINHRGTYRLSDGEKTVEKEHIQRATELAKDFHLPQDRSYVSRILKSYELDEMEHFSSPLGLYGKTLNVDYHLAHGITTRMKNNYKMVCEMHLSVEAVVFAPIATAQMALSHADRERGALLLDIGAGTTDFVLYLNGVICASGCIPLGGDHITNDIHLITGFAFSQCEKLKQMEGDAVASPQSSVGIARLKDDRGYAEVEVKRELLNHIIRARLEEIFELVKQRLPKDSLSQIKGGVFLTGGTSQMRGISQLAYECFGCDIYKTDSSDRDKGVATYKNPTLSTAIGLIRYAQIMDSDQDTKPSITKKLKEIFWPFSS